jgi:hypothetical protein
MRAWLLLAAALASCGDNARGSGQFEVVGHADLGARGMNAALAVVGSTVYVGSRIDNQPILIVDVADPAQPTVVGEIPGAVGMSSRELRVVPDRNLLIELHMRCAPDLHGCSPTGGEPEGLQLYDITDRRAPKKTFFYGISGTRLQPRSPHEFYLWRDDARVIAFVTAPPAGPALEIVDLLGTGAGPVKLATYDPRAEGLESAGIDNLLHSVSVSDDATQLFLSHQQGGLVVASMDGTHVALTTPPQQALYWGGPIGPHSAVKVPERDLLIVTEEVYPMPYGTGCPWGPLRIVDIADPTAPAVLSTLGLPENAGSSCANTPLLTTFTSHNATAERNIALVTWYAGGLQAVDIEDPALPYFLAELRPEPLPSVAHEDPYLGAVPVEMWSYPIIQDGLIYVVDVRNGLYILRYHGAHEQEILDEDFLEGNSNL